MTINISKGLIKNFVVCDDFNQVQYYGKKSSNLYNGVKGAIKFSNSDDEMKGKLYQKQSDKQIIKNCRGKGEDVSMFISMYKYVFMFDYPDKTDSTVYCGVTDDLFYFDNEGTDFYIEYIKLEV